MGSSSPQTTTTVNKTELPAWLNEASQKNLSIADSIAARPYQAYGGNTVAGFAPDTMAAWDYARSGVGATDPLYSAAANTAAVIFVSTSDTQKLFKGALRAKTEVWAHSCWGNPSQQRMFAQVQTYKPALEAYNQVDADVITFESSSSGGIDLEAIGKTITDEVSLGILGENAFDGTPVNVRAPGRAREIVGSASQKLARRRRKRRCVRRDHLQLHRPLPQPRRLRIRSAAARAERR